MERLFLFATLAGTRIAVETSEVEAVVRLNDVSPVPGMGAHIAGLSALRSRGLNRGAKHQRLKLIVCNVIKHLNFSESVFITYTTLN